MQQDSSYAERNAKRFKLVVEAFQKKDFEPIVHIVAFLMRPLDTAINRLLKRSSDLKAIRFQDSREQSIPELRAKCQQFFLTYASGGFGDSIIADFISQLKSDELAKHLRSCSDHSIPETCFHLIAFALSDIWWRFCLPAQTFPNRMFSLATCDQATFEQTWKDFRQICFKCGECVDVGFSGPLLQSIDLDMLSAQERSASIVELTD